MARKLIDLTGQRFGRWTVLTRGPDYESPFGDHKIVRWVCRCDCGKVSIVHGGALRRGLSTSCGCYHNEAVSRARKLSAKKNRYGRNAVYG